MMIDEIIGDRWQELYVVIFFFFNDTATTEIYTLSLHDALPIWGRSCARPRSARCRARARGPRSRGPAPRRDRKSTRLNSSHANISYAVFCLKKKKKKSTPLSHITLSCPHYALIMITIRPQCYTR